MDNAKEASAALIEDLRARPWGLAVASLAAGEIDIQTDGGDDPMDADSVFQIGSITKTITGVLLATAVNAGETSLDTTVGDVLGADASGAAGITLLSLATQRSGLPRLPPNLDPREVDPDDPYGSYREPDLLAALASLDGVTSGNYGYSNFGFMLLGLILRRVTGSPYPELVRDRIFEPLGMTTAGCPPPDSGRLPGYHGASPASWWTTNLPGAGGIGMSIRDLARYLEAHITPPEGPLGEAIELATTLHAEPPSGMGLGWGHQGGGWWHDGRTGGFCSFAGFHRPTGTAVALLANSSTAKGLTETGMEVLTNLVRGRMEQASAPPPSG